MTDHYRHLYASAPLPILSVDREGHVVACNPALAGLIGRSATELHGTPVLKWLSTTERDAARAGFLRAFESGKAEWDSVIRRWDGTLRPVRVQSVRQQTAKGVHLDVFLNERGVERSVRAADAAVLDLLTNMPGLFALVLDNELRIRHACGMSRTHWCKDLDVIGRELVSLLLPSDDNAVQLESLRREIARGESWAGTLRHIRADDSAFPVHVFATPRFDPRTREPVGLVLAGRETGDEVALRDQLEVADRLDLVVLRAGELDGELVALLGCADLLGEIRDDHAQDQDRLKDELHQGIVAHKVGPRIEGVRCQYRTQVNGKVLKEKNNQKKPRQCHYHLSGY